MIDQVIVTHHIQKHILSVLLHQSTARFRDMRPPKTDTNLYSYHLKLLVKNGLIEKTEQGYTLGIRGLSYVDHVNENNLAMRRQPKIITMFVVQNSHGDILLQKRTKQPYIGSWTLPYGKLHLEDVSIAAAAQREVREKLDLANQALTHAGDCYIRVKSNEEIVASTLAHVFRFEADAIQVTSTLQWARPHKLSQYSLAPAVERIMTRTFFRDPYFFEEYEEDWYNKDDNA